MNLMQASPVMFEWRSVYVEKKRPDYISEFVGLLVYSLCKFSKNCAEESGFLWLRIRLLGNSILWTRNRIQKRGNERNKSSW